MEGKMLKKCSTSTTDAVKKLKRKKKASVKKEKTKELVGKKRLCICVKGFDASLAKDDIKTALSNHFGSCGVITEVFVPTLRGTGASRGFAHISMTARDEDKALALDGSLLGGRMLEVRMATFGHPHNRGCKTCPLVYMEGKMEAFHDFTSWKIGQTFKKMCNNPTLNEQEVEQSIHT